MFRKTTGRCKEMAQSCLFPSCACQQSFPYGRTERKREVAQGYLKTRNASGLAYTPHTVRFFAASGFIARRRGVKYGSARQRGSLLQRAAAAARARRSLRELASLKKGSIGRHRSSDGAHNEPTRRASRASAEERQRGIHSLRTGPPGVRVPSKEMLVLQHCCVFSLLFITHSLRESSNAATRTGLSSFAPTTTAAQ